MDNTIIQNTEMTTENQSNPKQLFMFLIVTEDFVEDTWPTMLIAGSEERAAALFNEKFPDNWSKNWIIDKIPVINEVERVVYGDPDLNNRLIPVRLYAVIHQKRCGSSCEYQVEKCDQLLPRRPIRSH